MYSGSDLKDNKKLTSCHEPDLVSSFLAFAARLPDTSDTKFILDCRNKLVHDPQFTIDPKALEGLLKSTKHYLDKDRIGQYAMHTGIDVENRLASTEAHDRGHFAMRWDPEAETTAQPNPEGKLREV